MAMCAGPRKAAAASCSGNPYGVVRSHTPHMCGAEFAIWRADSERSMQAHALEVRTSTNTGSAHALFTMPECLRMHERQPYLRCLVWRLL
eukprot:176788-Chlamydomonas_euryale.AAC.3